MEAEIGIIGGTGAVPLELLEGRREVKVHTPYGSPSDLITLGVFEGRKISLLPRHGKSHTIPPGKINYRANIFALKELGVTRILSPSAVGSLQERIKPGMFVFPDQFIDRTQARPSSFYQGGQVCHISVAEPFCQELRDVLAAISRQGGLECEDKGVYVCIEGPRFSTRAESRLYRSWGGEVIGMTLVPEAVLAREAGICYASLSMVTDYDTFKEEPVSAEKILSTMRENEAKVKKLLAELIPHIPRERACPCKDALKDALV